MSQICTVYLYFLPTWSSSDLQLNVLFLTYNRVYSTSTTILEDVPDHGRPSEKVHRSRSGHVSDRSRAEITCGDAADHLVLPADLKKVLGLSFPQLYLQPPPCHSTTLSGTPSRSVVDHKPFASVTDVVYSRSLMIRTSRVIQT